MFKGQSDDTVNKSVLVHYYCITFVYLYGYIMQKAVILQHFPGIKLFLNRGNICLLGQNVFLYSSALCSGKYLNYLISFWCFNCMLLVTAVDAYLYSIFQISLNWEFYTSRGKEQDYEPAALWQRGGSVETPTSPAIREVSDLISHCGHKLLYVAQWRKKNPYEQIVNPQWITYSIKLPHCVSWTHLHFFPP